MEPLDVGGFLFLNKGRPSRHDSCTSCSQSPRAWNEIWAAERASENSGRQAAEAAEAEKQKEELRGSVQGLEEDAEGLRRMAWDPGSLAEIRSACTWGVRWFSRKNRVGQLRF